MKVSLHLLLLPLFSVFFSSSFFWGSGSIQLVCLIQEHGKRGAKYDCFTSLNLGKEFQLTRAKFSELGTSRERLRTHTWELD